MDVHVRTTPSETKMPEWQQKFCSLPLGDAGGKYGKKRVLNHIDLYKESEIDYFGRNSNYVLRERLLS